MHKNLTMQDDGCANYLDCGNYFTMYMFIKSHGTHEIYIILFVNYSSIKLKKKNIKDIQKK